MQIKSTMRCYFRLNKKAKIKVTDNTKCFEIVHQMELSYTAGGSINDRNILEII